ncbi:ABC transporter permease [Streptomyces sp. NPDC004838]
MLSVILRRIAISVPVLFVVSVIVFVLQWFIPGDTAVTMAGSTATAEQIEALRRQLHLDQPLYTQYFAWLGDVLGGSLGQSPLNGESVVAALNTRLPVTLSLVVGATLAATLAGLALGVLSSRGGRPTRRLSDVVSVLGMALPNFWVSLLLIATLSVSLGWFPSGGYVPLAESPGRWLWSLVLPVAALALHGMTAVAKQTREALLDVDGREFIRNLRANGIPERSILFKHALRAASIPVVTVSGVLFIGSLGGAVVIEHVFDLPGLGSLAIRATADHDIPMIQGVAVYFALLVMGVNLVLDLVYAWLNPKVRVT